MKIITPAKYCTCFQGQMRFWENEGRLFPMFWMWVIWVFHCICFLSWEAPAADDCVFDIYTGWRFYFFKQGQDEIQTSMSRNDSGRVKKKFKVTEYLDKWQQVSCVELIHLKRNKKEGKKKKLNFFKQK